MMMDNKLRNAFNAIQAPESLKAKTKAFVLSEAKARGSIQSNLCQRLVTAAACLLLVCLSGRWLYFTPTAQISIDINPSLELGINRFDKVISVTGYNDDGQALAHSLNVQYADYEDAIEEILEDEHIRALLSGDAVMTIAVVGPDGAQTVKILSDMQAHTAGKQNTYCFFAHREDVAAAHDLGLSYGKYRAFLEMQALDPGITPEQIRGMTMREIRNRMGTSFLGNQSAPLADETQGKGHRSAGSGHGRGAKKEIKQTKERDD